MTNTSEPGKGPSKQTQEFMNGYFDGVEECSDFTNKDKQKAS
jgi:hypothetical protein